QSMRSVVRTSNHWQKSARSAKMRWEPFGAPSRAAPHHGKGKAMSAQRRVGVGIIGAGNISSQYLNAMTGFDVLDIVGVADMKPEVARKRAAEFGRTALPVEALLADPRVEIVLNLTIPRAHVEVGLSAIAAGKHVYAEKPLGISFAE